MKEYMESVKSQLVCNATEEDKNKYITYDFTNKQVEDNIEYFIECKEDGLSPYKALLFFSEYLK